MNGSRLEVNDQDGNWQVHGEVSHAAVSALQSHAQALFQQRCPQAIDLAAVTRADSSAIALLVDWKRRARQAGRDVRFINAPSSIGRIAALYGTAGLLGLADPAGEPE